MRANNETVDKIDKEKNTWLQVFLLQGGVSEQEDVRGGSGLPRPLAVWSEASGETQCEGRT